jgi:hypothetical protein
MNNRIDDKFVNIRNQVYLSELGYRKPCVYQKSSLGSSKGGNMYFSHQQWKSQNHDPSTNCPIFTNGSGSRLYISIQPERSRPTELSVTVRKWVRDDLQQEGGHCWDRNKTMTENENTGSSLQAKKTLEADGKHYNLTKSTVGFFWERRALQCTIL